MFPRLIAFHMEQNLEVCFYFLTLQQQNNFID